MKSVYRTSPLIFVLLYTGSIPWEYSLRPMLCNILLSAMSLGWYLGRRHGSHMICLCGHLVSVSTSNRGRSLFLHVSLSGLGRGSLAFRLCCPSPLCLRFSFPHGLHSTWTGVVVLDLVLLESSIRSSLTIALSFTPSRLQMVSYLRSSTRRTRDAV